MAIANDRRVNASETSEAVDPNRRRWLHTIIAVIIGSITSVLSVVVGGAAVAPGFRRRDETWVSAGRVADLDDETPTAVTLRLVRQDGYAEAIDQRVVFLVKSESGSVRALSSTCTHLGCRVSYDATDRLLKCPCHGGTFALDGRVIAGPPPGGLAELTSRVEDERVFVRL